MLFFNLKDARKNIYVCGPFDRQLLHLVKRVNFNASILLADDQFFIAIACHVRKAHAVDAAATFQHPFHHWMTFLSLLS